MTYEQEPRASEILEAIKRTCAELLRDFKELEEIERREIDLIQSRTFPQQR